MEVEEELMGRGGGRRREEILDLGECGVWRGL